MKIKFILALIISAFISSYCLSSDEQKEGEAVMSVEQVREKINTDSTVYLLDVRTEPEFTGELGHVEGAVLIPLSELETRLAELQPYKERDIIVICRSGNRSGQATTLLRSEGYKAFNMVGGMRAWNAMIDSTKNENAGK